jgi:hypothetical protein
MRNTLLLILLACNLFAGAQAFSLTNGESVLVYSLPKTQFCFEVETEKVTQKPGIFYRYSERYLATTNVVTKEKVSYRLKGMKVTTQAIPDSTRTYAFVQTKKMLTNHIVVNSKGILCGINVPLAEKAIADDQIEDTVEESPVLSNLLPLGEEYMMAGSEAKLAEGAAKQIYQIRESRMSLLTADGEKIPADGASLKLMLDGMNKLEHELTELFIGKTITETQTQKVFLTPSKAKVNEVLFRLSALRGLVASDDLSGDPYFISIIPSRIKTTDSKAKKETPALYYVLPASTSVTINNGVNTIFSEKFNVPQFGVTVPLSEDFFKQSNVKIQIDPQTGRLLSVE